MDNVEPRESWERTYLRKGWKHERCSLCVAGVCASYDDGGPEECRHCWGNGHFWITPKGRHVAWPGGPFV